MYSIYNAQKQALNFCTIYTEMRREKLDHFVTTRMIKENHIRGKQGGRMLHGLAKWLKLGRVTRNRDRWNVKSTCFRMSEFFALLPGKLSFFFPGGRPRLPLCPVPLFLCSFRGDVRRVK